MQCSYCNAKAVYFRRYSGQSFCPDHFKEYVERKVYQTIKKEKLINSGEKVAIAISGGKDSITLAWILKKLSDRLNIEMESILIDEGITSYRDKTLKIAEEFCSKNGIKLHIMSFYEEYGITLDDMVERGEKTPCTYCGVFRRELLNKKALEISADKLATGHNLDDEVQAILMNFIKGDINRLARLASTTGTEGMVARIKPLKEIPEKEVALYAMVSGLPVSLEECPYAMSFRVKIRDIINSLEEESPGIKFSILRGYQKLLPCITSTAKKPSGRCSLCSKPSTQVVCSSCRLKKELKIL